MARQCEVLTGQGWRVRAFETLEPGMAFRLFEADGTPVKDADGTWRWRALGPPGRDEAGRPTIDAEPVPETEAERAVRTEGMYWPQGGGGNRFR